MLWLKTFECKNCGDVFDELVDKEDMISKCPMCSGTAEPSFLFNIPKFKIARRHQSAPKDKDFDSHPLDGGIPFGEVAGDEAFEDLKNRTKPEDLKDYKGPLP